MPGLDNASFEFPQPHTQSYKRFATVVKKQGKHVECGLRNKCVVLHVPCNETSEQVPAGLLPGTPVSRTLSQDPKVLDFSVTGRQEPTAVGLSGAWSFIPWILLIGMSWRDALAFCSYVACSHSFCCECLPKKSWLTFTRVAYRYKPRSTHFLSAQESVTLKHQEAWGLS